MKTEYLAVVLGDWLELNKFFDDGWKYVDSHIIEKKGKVNSVLVVLAKGDNVISILKVN